MAKQSGRQGGLTSNPLLFQNKGCDASARPEIDREGKRCIRTGRSIFQRFFSAASQAMRSVAVCGVAWCRAMPELVGTSEPSLFKQKS
jgi:hypothetical protein